MIGNHVRIQSLLVLLVSISFLALLKVTVLIQMEFFKYNVIHSKKLECIIKSPLDSFIEFKMIFFNFLLVWTKLTLSMTQSKHHSIQLLCLIILSN